jgi:hypothetical protein
MSMQGEPSTPDEWPTMIEDCKRRESKLSDWERSFIDSIEDRLAKGFSLTPNQVARLDEIWEKVT